MRLPAPILEAAERIARRVVPAGDCLVWPGAIAGSGRPCIRIGGKTYYCARVVLAVKLGRPLKRGKLAAHQCDNPKCLNPDHLDEESFSSNLQAAWSRRRRVCRPKLIAE